MDQFMEIASNHFVRAIAGCLQQSVIAESHTSIRIHAAEARDYGIQYELQFSLQLTVGAFGELP
jgi:hypothetical protein